MFCSQNAQLPLSTACVTAALVALGVRIVVARKTIDSPRGVKRARGGSVPMGIQGQGGAEAAAAARERNGQGSCAGTRRERRCTGTLARASVVQVRSRSCLDSLGARDPGVGRPVQPPSAARTHKPRASGLEMHQSRERNEKTVPARLNGNGLRTTRATSDGATLATRHAFYLLSRNAEAMFAPGSQLDVGWAGRVQSRARLDRR